MVMEKLGDSLQGALKKLIGAGRIDERTVNEVVKDIQRALLQADVNVKLVMGMSQRIKERAMKEEPPAGMNPREHVIRIVYQELMEIIGKGAEIQLKPQTIMMVGLQGSGKTTSAAKLARYFQRKGLKAGVVAADTFRPGAYHQLKTLAEKLNVGFYGEEGNPDAVEITNHGLKALEKYDIKIVDTAGRHALEADLIEEMEQIHAVAKPDHKFMVLDAGIGQQASQQAHAFNDSVGITGVIITKLDGTAKGGGALSAVSETKAPIAFIGVGETPEDFEKFEADRFISRLLGMGDLKSLMEKAEESLSEEDVNVEALMQGRFTLKDMYKQLEAMNKMGPLKQIMSMLPMGGMGGMKFSDEMFQATSDKMKNYKVIMDSMTEEEMTDPRVIGGSRIKRISKGSGCSSEDVRELLKYHKTMQTALKGFRGGKFNIQKMMKKKMGM
ncbi:Signal recognition particle, subunit Ffh SRP54 [Methanosarcina siciliae C2J]|uniref:Signal recognition particle 54 kDa protein n=3 Tax=Methanosarcina siciliae TaxID=38027 RepID=A0A0E3PBN1_9EURY|nr:signal recognition particle protein Srp54 [Methanosarcina siciliae]AKB26776.1 Signal recognition particle, subunit Ffh SRP54 [Methanosarcina siciliae T4/M]AKB30747.1 Signal recognition particle, subunit Ffh SRP54 [Methanosarcina siciliae HI350]AKB34654.1 Signal recognition particle, subunit Ffh SRP54 [Methanosarcina siciliae C2J]